MKICLKLDLEGVIEKDETNPIYARSFKLIIQDFSKRICQVLLFPIQLRTIFFDVLLDIL